MKAAGVVACSELLGGALKALWRLNSLRARKARGGSTSRWSLAQARTLIARRRRDHDDIAASFEPGAWQGRAWQPGRRRQIQWLLRQRAYPSSGVVAPGASRMSSWTLA